MPNKTHHIRNNIAYITMAVSVFSLVALAIVAIVFGSENNAMTIFHTVLPVLASWVGTILAFYFGRENFESANSQVRKMIDHLSPDERSNASLESIMRSQQQVILKDLSSNVSEISIGQLKEFLVKNKTSRLIVVNNGVVTHIVHESSFDKYIASGGAKEDLFSIFLSKQEQDGTKYTANHAFVLFPKTTTLKEAKEKMASKNIQDIVITENGRFDEPMIGWLSNIRISRFLS